MIGDGKYKIKGDYAMHQSFKIKVNHVAIQTTDFDRSFRFYTELLGLAVVKEPFRFKGRRTLTMLDAGSILIELYSVKDGTEPQVYDDRRVGADHIAFEVDNLDALISHLRANGICVLKEPFLPPTGDINQPRVAFIEGIDGEEIELREAVQETEHTNET